MKNTVIYPGTFDPITLGHVDVIERAVKLFDRVIVGIGENIQKKPLFDLQERVALAKQSLIHLNNVEVVSFNCLLTEFARNRHVNIILRGLRVISDFDYEFQMASVNRTIEPELETVFLTPADRFTYVSSSIVRQLALSGGDVSKFVPTVVNEALKRKGRY